MSLVEDVSRSLPSHSHVSAVLRQEAQIPWAVAFVQPLLLDSLIESHRVAEAAGELIDALLPIVMVEHRTISVLIARDRKRVALTVLQLFSAPQLPSDQPHSLKSVSGERER